MAGQVMEALQISIDQWIKGTRGKNTSRQAGLRRLTGLRDSVLQTVSASLLHHGDGASGPELPKKLAAKKKKKTTMFRGISSGQDQARKLPPAELLNVCPHAKLPASIRANLEPYKPGDWRIEPFPARPYTRLSGGYDVPEPEWSSVIELKLSTSKHGHCLGKHCTRRGPLGWHDLMNDRCDSDCTCLVAKTECDAGCTCDPEGMYFVDGIVLICILFVHVSVCRTAFQQTQEQYPSFQCAGRLNRAVSQSHGLVLGKDVDEIDVWGMDCYTRRNILDGKLGPPEREAARS